MNQKQSILKSPGSWGISGLSLIGIISVTLIYEIFFHNPYNKSYLPLIVNNDQIIVRNITNEITLKNILVGISEKGKIYLIDRNNNNILFVKEFLTEFKKDNINSKNKIEYFEKVIVNDSSIRYKTNNNYLEYDFEIKTDSINNSIIFNTNIRYKKSVEIEREAYLFLLNIIPNSLITKNGLTDSKFNSNEYWLGDGGILIETTSNNLLFLNNSRSISSSQYDNKNNNLYVNLDYNKDHPHTYILPNQNGKWIDKSNSIRKPGDSISHSFLFNIFDKKTPFLKLMKTPFGFLSTFIFTEHADNTDLRTQKAVYFGSENIVKSEKAIGGFVKHQIPVTKSVFYTNNLNLTNNVFNNDFESPQLYIKNNHEYSTFIDDLFKTNLYEICLHSVDPLNDDRKDVTQALEVFKDKYNISTWIDHGISDGNSNREAFVCEGLDPDSEYYIADLWHKNNVKYFWNSSIERFSNCFLLKNKIKDFNLISFLRCFRNRITGNIDLLKSEIGQQIPSPIYWEHPSVTDKFISWGTLNHSGHHYGWVWDYIYSEKRIRELIINRGIHIAHFYPAFVGKSIAYFNGIWEINNGEIVINNYFDKVLQRLSEFRNEGLLNLITIKEFLDYQYLIKNIEVIYYNNGLIKIINHNNDEIKGLSFSVIASNIYSKQKQINQKQIDGEKIFWFDINAREEVEFILSD